MTNIASQYDVSDALPEVFKLEVWQGDRPISNRTAADAQAVIDFINKLGPNWRAGLCAALPDAMAGGQAPALSLELLVKGGYEKARLNYGLDVMGSFGGTLANTTTLMIGDVINILDGPQGSATERVSRVLSQVLGGVDAWALLCSCDVFAQAMDFWAADLLKPFAKS